MGSRALVIVEGDLEDEFFKRLAEVFSIDMEIVPFRGNVSMLYDEMEEDGFFSDIIAILRKKAEKAGNPDQRKILEGDYSDIFLMMDLDPQHGLEIVGSESPDDALRRNFRIVMEKARKMAEELNESTDPTRGKLYINHPSMESFRDADDFFDDGFASKKVQVADLCKKPPFNGSGYKSISAKAGLQNKKHLGRYDKGDFSKLATMNAFKLRFIHDGQWNCFDYDQFRMYSNQLEILRRQQESVECELHLWVLNTSLFILFDYKGRSYYDECVQSVSAW